MGSLHWYVLNVKIEKKPLLHYLKILGSDQLITPRQFLRNLEMKPRQEDEQ